MANQVDKLADYTALGTTLANSKLATLNPSAYQILKGLITNAQNGNTFLNQQFTDINGQQTSLQDGLQSALDSLSAINSEVSALSSTVASLTANLAALTTLVTNTFNDRNNSAYGASAYNSGSQTLSNATPAVMVLDTDIFGSMRSGNTFVAPVAAEYMICGQVAFAPSGAGARKINISSSGGISVDVGLATAQGLGGENVEMSFALFVSLATSESIQANLTQDSGGNLAAQGALQIFRVSYA